MEFSQELTQLISALVTQYPWLVTMFTVVGVLRVVMKPIMTIAHAIADATQTKKDDMFLKEIKESKSYKVFTFILDWLASVKIKRDKK